MALRGPAGDAGGGRGTIRAADADRDHVAGLLGTAYSEGRLSKDEYDARLEAAFAARTYGELDRLIADLPVPVLSQPPAPAPAVVPASERTNGLALASFLFGLAQIAIGPLGTIPAIVLGHMAQQQIKRTGERGAGLALAGLVLGWGAVLLGIVLFFVVLMALARTPGPMQMPGP